MSKTGKHVFEFNKLITRSLLILLVLSIVLVAPFGALANTENTHDSGVSSTFISYGNLQNSIINFFHIFGFTTPLYAVNSSNNSELINSTFFNTTQNDTNSSIELELLNLSFFNITQNDTNLSNDSELINTSFISTTQNHTNSIPKHISNASGKVVDNGGAPLICDIILRNSNGVKKQDNKVTQYDSTITNSDLIIFDARRSKNVSAKFKLQTGSDNGTVVLDNFGKFKPANVKKPDFYPLKYVEIHAENVSYDNVEISVTYTDEELAGFDENKLVLYHYTNGNWIPLSTIVNSTTNTVTAYVYFLSTFAIGQNNGINVYSQIDGHVNPNKTVVISGAVYYDNLTAVSGASVYVNITGEAISKSVTSDSDGNFHTSFSAPSIVGNYGVTINATIDSMSVNSTKSLEVTNSPHFKLTGEIIVTNQDVVAPESNVTFEYGVPTGAVVDNSTITITGMTSVAGNKTYNVYTDKKVEWGSNASGTYTFIVDSLTEGQVSIIGGSIITNALSYDGSISASDSYNKYLDSEKVNTDAYAVDPGDHDTWYWSETILPSTKIKYNQSQTIDLVTTSSTTTVRFNLTSDVKIGFTVSGLSKPTNTSFYVDNIKLISTIGELGSVSANMTGYMNDTTDLTITSDTQGGVKYTTFTSFHDDLDASLVNTGPNYTATLSVTNDNINDWDNVNFYYCLPQGSYNIIVTDTDNSLNSTSSCTIPSDGGDLVIPSSVVDTIHSGSSRAFTIGYSLKQLNVTTVTDKETYAPGQDITFTTDVLYDDSLTSGANVTIQVTDPDDVLVINESATWDGSNYSLTSTTDQAWKIGIYHVTVNATQTIDGVGRTGIYNTSFAEKKLIMYVQGNGPYLQCCNITIDGRAFYSDNTVASGEVVNITVGSTNTSAVVNATGYYNVTIPGFEVGTYNLNATITDELGLTDTDDDTIIVLDEPFFVLVDSDLTEMSGQVLMTTNHTFTIDVPSDIDVLSSTINLTGITEKTTDYDVSPPPISMESIGTTQFNFVNGTFAVTIPPYKSVIVNDFNMTVTAFPQGTGTQESVFNNSIDGVDVGESHYVVADNPSTHSWSDDITARVSPGTTHEIRITKLGTFTIDYRFLVMGHVNQTGFLDTPVNPRAYIDSNIVYAESGDMLTSSHVTDITKYMQAGSNPLYFENDRNALVNYKIQLKIRDWNYTQETVTEPTDKFEIESIIYAAATDQAYNNPEIRHMMKKFASNLTVFDMDNNIEITSENYTVSNDELFIHTEAIGSINAGNVRIFNVSYDAPRPNISPSVNKTDYNTGDDILISANVTFEGSPVTDANVSAIIYNSTVPEIWGATLTYTGGGVYTGNYSIPANATLGAYTVSIEAYNDNLNRDNETVGYVVRRLNVVPNAGGPYIVDSSATISGYVYNMADSSPIDGATVNITISNSSGIVNQSDVISAANGYYSYIRAVDLAGDYNVSLSAIDSNGIIGTANDSYEVKYDVSLTTNRTSCNSGDHIEVNVSVHDKSSMDVSTGTVIVLIDIPGIGIETMSTDNGRLAYSAGYYSGTFTNTTNLGPYNMTVTASTAIASGNDTGSVRVSTLSVTEYMDKTVYIADDNVNVWGSVYDNEAGVNASGASYNVSIWRGAQYVTSSTGSTGGIGEYSVTFPGLMAGSYTADVDVTYDTLVGSNTTPFEIRYNVTTVIPKSLYGINEQVGINISVFDVGLVPVTGAVLIVNITNSTVVVESLTGSNITDNVNGYYTTNFTSDVADDFNITAHVENGSVIGDAAIIPFRATGFYSSVDVERTTYEARENVSITGSLWDSQLSPRQANVTIKVIDSQGSVVQNVILINQFTNYTYGFDLNSTALAGTYTVWVNASEIESGGSLFYNNSTYFVTELISNAYTNHSWFNPEDTVGIRVHVANGSVDLDGGSVGVVVEAYDLWDDFSGTYMDLEKVIPSTPGVNYLDVIQSDELIFNISNLSINDTWVERDVRLNTTLSDNFVLEYDIRLDGNSEFLVGRLTIGNDSNYIRFNLINYQDDASDGYNVHNIPQTWIYSNSSDTNAGLQYHFIVKYNSSVISFYRDGVKFTEKNFTLPVDSSIKLKGYAKNSAIGSTADIRFDNVTFYNVGGAALYSGTATGVGNGNYTVDLPLAGAELGMYHVGTNVTKGVAFGDASTSFLVRELNITTTTYGSYNFNGSHNGPVAPIIISGYVLDNVTRDGADGASVTINIDYPNSTQVTTRTVTADSDGCYNYNFSSNFTSGFPAGQYNFTVSSDHGGVTNVISSSFNISTVSDSWSYPAKDFRVPLMLNNTGNDSSQTYSGSGFVLELPGGVDQSSVIIRDINGDIVSNSMTWDNVNTIDVTLANFTLGMFEDRMIYVYFDRDNGAAPDTSTITYSGVPLIEGTVEGYWIDIAKDSALYSPSSTAQIFANLTLTDDSPLSDAEVNFTVYYPNGTIVYGPHNNVTDSSSISMTGNSAVLNYSIPSVKGMFAVTVNSTSGNGIPRTESSTFNVGGLAVEVSTDKQVYNTRENVLFTVNVSDVGTPINGATVNIDVNDESGILPYEFQASPTTDSNGVAQTVWYIPTNAVLGNYSITVNVNTANDSGYNGSETFMVDRYELGLTTNTQIIGFNEPIVVNGTTIHNYSSVDSYANVSAIYQSGFIDDVVPFNAISAGSWNWDYNLKHSGVRSHYQEASDSGTSGQQHNFYDAYSGYRVDAGENISVWIYIDSDSEPVDEIMLQFYAENSWEHRAYWGSDLINWGTNNTNSRRPKGSLPSVGQWVQLNITTTELGLDGLVIDGVGFVLNENSSSTAKVWFDDVHFSGETTYDSYLENQNVTSTGGSYVVNLNSSYVIGEYLVISNSSYVGLSRSNVTGIMVANMNVTADAGGPYSPSIGNVTISGHITDNRSGVDRASNVSIDVVNPLGQSTIYSTTSASNGTYSKIFSTPLYSGTYQVWVNATDSHGIVGNFTTTFRVRQNISVSVNNTPAEYNFNEHVNITATVDTGAGLDAGCDVTINVTKPNASIQSFTTSGQVSNNGDGTYSLIYTGTDQISVYDINVTSSNGTDEGEGSTTFNVRSLDVTLTDSTAPYIAGENTSISGTVKDNSTSSNVNGTATINVTYPNGEAVEYSAGITSGVYSRDITLNESGRYNIYVSAVDTNGIAGISNTILVDSEFLITVSEDMVSYNPGDNVTVTLKAFNGTGYESGVNYVTNLSYGNGTFISSNNSVSTANGSSIVVFSLPDIYYTFNITSTATKGITIGSNSSITSTSNLRMWVDPAEALVGHSSWPVDVTPTDRRDLTIYTELLDRGGHVISDRTVNASIYRYDGVILENITLTNDNGLYSGNYNVSGNAPEGQYWFELDDYPEVKQYFSVVEWGCTRCHVNAGMSYGHYYSHTTTSSPRGHSDGPVYPSNFSKEYVHEMHPVTGSSSAGCGRHSGKSDWNCVKCHPTEVLPSACPDCHNSANNKGASILTSEYGADVHAGINTDIAQGKSATTSNGGNVGLAVDGDEQTMWEPDNVATQIMEIDLGALYPVDGVRIAMGNYRATYTIEGWNGTWISLVSSTTYINYGNDKTFSFSQQNISKVKITVSAWNRVQSGSNCWGASAATVTQKPQVKSINVYTPNDLPGTAANPTSHIACQACHGGDIPNDIQPTIPECTDCHPQSSGSSMQVMPPTSGDVRQLDDYEDVTGISAYSVSGFPVSTVTFTASTDQKTEGTKSGKLEYTMANYVGRVYVDNPSLDFTNATSINFWLYGNPSDNDTQFQISIRNNKSGLWHYNTAQNLNWTGWRLVNIPIASLSQVDILYISFADVLRIQLDSSVDAGNTGTIYIDDLYVERVGTHTLYQEARCGLCHDSGHDRQPSPQCQTCHQTQSHGNALASAPTCADVCHYMENGKLIVRNIDHNNTTTLVEIPMDGAVISQCSICHDPNEPHDKQWNYVCMDCHRDSRHGAVDPAFTAYEKASTCLKCHNDPHDLTEELASVSGCNGCHQLRIHGQSTLTTEYNESIHLDCMRCHGLPLNESEPLPVGLGNAGKIHLNDEETFGTASDECMFCHGNASFSYELHTGQTVDQSNTTLVESIQNGTICDGICHNPAPSFADHNDEDRDELLNEPHAKYVSGHGNVSCLFCHGHQPAKLTLGLGTNCVGCHMGTSQVVQLSNNTIPKNSKTVVVNNSSTQWLVTSPQVLGHGNTDCSECHGHANSELTYTGSSEADCLACHEDNSSTALLLEYAEPKSNNTVKLNEVDNTWNVTPPQVMGHGNVTCTECHTHAPSDFEDTNSFLGSDCMDCHGNSSRNVTLINNSINKNDKTVVVDNTSSRWIVSSPQVLGHGNASCSACHGHTNSDLTYVGGDDSACINCHEDDTVEIALLLDSGPMSATTVIVNDSTNPKIVTPPQVSGHGNVSCAECHEHSPSDFADDSSYSLLGGNCSSCHKNSNKTTNLINGTVPTNDRTNVTNSPNSTLIVIAPQVFGHGRVNEVDCFVCHGHTNSRLSSPGECNMCHNNQTKFNELNVTPDFYEPPQVSGHGNMSCSACHAHDTPNLVFLGETEDQCLECHINSSTDNSNNTWNLLNNTESRNPYTVVVNDSSSQWLVNPPQVAKHGNTSCIYCHSHAPSDYEINTVTTSGTDCITCHFNSSAPIIPLNNGTVPYCELTNWTNEANQTPALVIPPQIEPHGDTNKDGISNSTDCYDCHGHNNPNLINVKDCNTCHSEFPTHPIRGAEYNGMDREGCMVCHVEIHAITSGGGPNCLASFCHGGIYKPLNTSLFNDSVHIDLNSEASNSSSLVYEFEKSCWLCHGNGTEPDVDTHLSNLTTVRTCYDTVYCHGNASLDIGVLEHFKSGQEIIALGSKDNDTESCVGCHNLTEMKVSGTDEYVNGTGLYLVSHFAQNYTPISSLRNSTNSTDYCLACHNDTNSIFYNASIINKTTTHGTNCSACHGAGMIHDDELASVSGEGISDCLDCHSNPVYNKFINTTIFNDSVHANFNSGANNTSALNFNSSKDCWLCHGNGTQPTTHPSNLTTVRTCADTVYCHGNTTLNQNVSVVEHFVNGTDIQTSNGADDTSSCVDCHNLTDMKVAGAPTDESGTHLASHYARNYTTISSLRNKVNSTTYCLACHNNTNSIFYNASIITTIITANHGENCSSCHGAGNIHDETLSRPQTTGNCTDCHAQYGINYSSTIYHVNVTAINLGVHANVNNNMSSVAAASPVNDINNSKCWGCHVIGGAYPENGHADTINNGAYFCYDCHNGTAKAYANVSSAPAVYNHIKDGVNISARTVAATTSESCGYGCHNLTSMKVPGFEGVTQDYSYRQNLSQPSHYAKNRTDIHIEESNISDCMWCHKNSTNEFIDIFERNGTNSTADIPHAENLDSCLLSDCHTGGRIHDQNLTKPTWAWDDECKNCHFGLVDSIYYMNGTMFNSSVHVTANCTDCHVNEASSHPIAEYNWKWCECCHSYQSDPINQSDRHNVTRTPSTYSYNGTNVLEITDCTTCHDATAYNEAVEYYNTSENNCRYCHAYPNKGDMASQDWF